MTKHNSQSSQQWLQEHQTDPYVKQAIKEGYRSRAVYKLAQIDTRDRLFHSGMTVIDLGAAPGGWSQWLSQRFLKRIQIIALDILPMESIPHVTFIQGDFHEQATLDTLLLTLEQNKVDMILSDMAPNSSGIKTVDQARSMLLAELARDLALTLLTPKGNFLVKVFQGEGFDDYLRSLRQHFKQVLIRKPDASRARSREIYLLAKQLKINY